MFGPDMFKGNDVREVSKNLLGCQLHCPKSEFPIKEGMITEVQWYDVEDKDPSTTEDKQNHRLIKSPRRKSLRRGLFTWFIDSQPRLLLAQVSRGIGAACPTT